MRKLLCASGPMQAAMRKWALCYTRISRTRGRLEPEAAGFQETARKPRGKLSSPLPRRFPAECSSAKLNFKRLHSESAPTRTIPAEGSPASVHMVSRALRHARSPQRVRWRAFKFERRSAEGSSASFQIRSAPQRERSDTRDPRRGFIPQMPARPFPGQERR